MVALSVSISANTSPLVTLSPTFLCQPAITPSVIVSLKRGINTTSSIVLASILFVVVAGLAVEAAGVVGALVLVAVFAALAIGEVAAAEAPRVFAAISAVISSPCFPNMANKSFTCNLPPRGVPICNKIPS